MEQKRIYAHPPASCKHKHKLFTCKQCAARVCAACVQLETHGCPGLASKKAEDLALLDKALIKVVALKVASFS